MAALALGSLCMPGMRAGGGHALSAGAVVVAELWRRSPSGAGTRGVASFPGASVTGRRFASGAGPNIGGRAAHCALTSSGARKPEIQLPLRQPRCAVAEVMRTSSSDDRIFAYR